MIVIFAEKAKAAEAYAKAFKCTNKSKIEGITTYTNGLLLIFGL